MGLDNGIYAKNLALKDIPGFVQPFFRYREDLDLCYWRKCWNVRNDILRVLPKGNPDDYEYRLNAENIAAIKAVIEKYFSLEYFQENNDCIWDYEEILPTMITCYINLSWFEGYLKEHPDIECYFYDSY